MVEHTDKQTLPPYVHRYTDEWRAYERVEREHRTVARCQRMGPR